MEANVILVMIITMQDVKSSEKPVIPARRIQLGDLKILKGARIQKYVIFVSL